MLSLRWFPNELVSGLTMDELKQQQELHSKNDLIEQVMFEDDHCPTLDELLALVPLDATSELEAIATDQYEATKVASTEKQEVAAVRKLKSFLEVYNFSNFDIDTCSLEELATKLKYFYATLRKDDGTFYAPTSLVCMRAGLFRYFLRVRKVNIIENDTFALANLALKALGRLFLKAGGRIEHFEAICKEDQEKLARYFDRSTPTILMHEVYFVLIYFFGQRGREWIRGLTVDSLVFEQNDLCGSVVRLRTGLQKTVGTKLTASGMDDNKEAILKATGGDHCPVQAIRLYLEKRAATASMAMDAPLFLTPKKAKDLSAAWYTKQPLGVNGIGGMMKAISQAAGLSKQYTAHNIRPTVVADLHEAGFRLEQICKVTGHKDAKTAQRYLTHGKRKATEMASISDALSVSLYGAAGSNRKPGHQPQKQDTSGSFSVSLDTGSSRPVAQPSPTQQIVQQIAVQPSNDSTGPAFSLNFNGHFENCTFNFK